jgi:AraC family transcriptional regulator
MAWIRLPAIQSEQVARVRVNPPELSVRSPNTILSGRGRRYQVDGFVGPLSIKSIVDGGVATWETPTARHLLAPTSLLVLNRGQRYSMTIDAAAPVETFCLFFAPTFVPSARRALVASDRALLDEPEDDGAPFEMAEAVQPAPRLMQLLRRMHAAMRAGDVDALEPGFYAAARALVATQSDVRRALARLPAARAATREELHRRLQRARSLADESYVALGIDELARAACLSPHHFHRQFTRLFGETPHRYAVHRRLERAAGRLRASDAPVLEIALAHGFASLGSFTTLFARRFGAPPAAWRKKQG